MSKKKVKKVVKPEAPKEKKPKIKLISYTMKAVIPVGAYANIQPEITVEAETVEQAERFTMGYIEAMFAKYRADGTQGPTPKPVTSQVTVAAKMGTYEQAAKSGAEMLKSAASMAPNSVEAPAAIVLSEPFKRAKNAIESCTSHDALKLVADQIEKSVKLIDTEKAKLKNLITVKTNDITIAKTK